MKYIKNEFKIPTLNEEMAIYLLNEEGITTVEIENDIPLSQEEKEEMFVDILPDPTENRGISTIKFYLEENEENIKLITKAKDALKDFDETIIFTQSIEDDQDWLNNWKKYFVPFYVEDILVCPSWDRAENTMGGPVVEIDPGSAFGSGTHETTKLCMRELKKYINSETKVLDMGCGSGILSILANRLGAKEVTGVDIDKHAVDIAIENYKINGLKSNEYNAYAGDIMSNEELVSEIGVEKYDVVVANILAQVIIGIAEKLVVFIKKNGILIVSGIIKGKKQEVERALIANNIEIIASESENDWVSITGRRI